MDKLTAILRAAGELIAAKGFEETSVQEIADRAGVAAGTVIYHFKTKHNLLFILTRQIQYRILGQARSAVAGALDPRLELHALINAYFEYALAHPTDILVVQKSDPYLIIDMSRFPNKDYTLILRQHSELYRHAIERGIACGLFKSVPVEAMCTLITSLLHGLSRLTCYGHEIGGYRQDVLQLIDGCLLAVCHPPKPPQP